MPGVLRNRITLPHTGFPASCREISRCAEAQCTRNDLNDSRAMYRRNSASSLGKSPNAWRNSSSRRSGPSSTSGFFADNIRRYSTYSFGCLMDEEVGQGPGLRVGVQRPLRVGEAFVVADQGLQRVGGAGGKAPVELLQPRLIQAADALPTFRAVQIGRLEIHGDPLAEPAGTIAQPRVQPAVEGDLVRGLVDDRRDGAQGLGLGQNLVDLGRRADASVPLRLQSGQIVHRHPVGESGRNSR